MRTKTQLLEKYAAACKLRTNQPFTAWLVVFPTAESFKPFRAEAGNFCWSEKYWQSPFDDAYSMAYDLAEGLSETSLGFWRKCLAKENPCPYDLGKISILADYGQPQAIALLKELNYAV